MEMGSSSSSSSLSSDSLNGLKFGQKIYFEDVGVGAPTKSGGGSSSTAAAAGTPPKKGRSGSVHGGQPPRCQVEGCKVDLSDAKAYYSRHKVCSMHSKSPKVIVAGLEQRFCQQCSRFHQLPEFDQGKRSCRRRLAGHNERRRKPPVGSLFSSHYGRPSSSVLDTTTGGGFVMDFSTFPRFAGRDIWPTTRAPDQISRNQPTATGKFLPNAWQNQSENPPPDLFLQGSASGTHYSAPTGECFAGVSSDSGCALSLLSNQPWGPRAPPSSHGVSNFFHADGAPMVQSAATHAAPVNHFSSTSWGQHEIPRDPGLHQISQPVNNHYSGELDLAEHSRAYDSSTTQHMHWSL